MSNIYLYNGDYSSLLNLIIELLKQKINPDNIKNCDYEPNLLEQIVNLKLDNKNNLKILNKMPKIILKSIYYVYLSNNENKELLIFEFLKYAFKYKEDVFRYRNIDSINEVIKIIKYVGSEAHKLKGFLRFKQVKNFYYAVIEPTNNVISILATHFKKRLSEELWIIYDKKRNIYALYDLKKVIYLKESEFKSLNLDLDENEKNIEELWKTFFKTISIKERKNLKCQMNFMPKKYWKNMLEMEDRI